LLVGNETRQALKDRFSFCELDIIAVKGKTEGVRIHTIVSKNNSLPNHEVFLDDYRSKKWDSALKHAKFCKKAIPELSGYYDMMIERINYLQEHEPGENWDTVFRATSK
jgi:adenylate cyclase